jgi:MEMO1 family protein
MERLAALREKWDARPSNTRILRESLKISLEVSENTYVAALSAQHHPACYPSEADTALAFFRDALSTYPAAEMPAAPSGVSLLGIVTPHIDFRVSLQSYAAAFQPLMKEPLADRYIILGVGHRSQLEWNFDRRDYETPLGRAICATDLVDALAAGADPARHFSEAAHKGEHSIEFALAWLQALHKLHPQGNDKPVRFAPLLCGGLYSYVDGRAEWDALTEFHQLARNFAETLRHAVDGETIRVIVSIDGCHMGPRFQHPFRVTPKLLKATAGWEELLWASAAEGDARKFLDWFRAEGNDRYFDGVGALALLMAAGQLTVNGPYAVQRTFYEQWFTENDASVVTFSSGKVFQRIAQA